MVAKREVGSPIRGCGRYTALASRWRQDLSWQGEANATCRSQPPVGRLRSAPTQASTPFSCTGHKGRVEPGRAVERRRNSRQAKSSKARRLDILYDMILYV